MLLYDWNILSFWFSYSLVSYPLIPSSSLRPAALSWLHFLPSDKDPWHINTLNSLVPSFHCNSHGEKYTTGSYGTSTDSWPPMYAGLPGCLEFILILLVSSLSPSVWWLFQISFLLTHITLRKDHNTYFTDKTDLIRQKHLQFPPRYLPTSLELVSRANLYHSAYCFHIPTFHLWLGQLQSEICLKPTPVKLVLLRAFIFL